MSVHRSKFPALALAALAAGVLALSACGGEESTSASTGSSSGGSAPGLAEAKDFVAKLAERPTSVGLPEAIGKEVPTGKKLTFISCGVEACELQGDIIKEGAADLGWTAETIGTDGSPEQLQNAFETALRQGSDAVILNAVTRATVAKQIEEAEEKGVAFVTCCSTEQTGDGILYNASPPAQSARIGEALAAHVVADSEGDASTLYVNISAFTILEDLGDKFKSSYQEYCPDCGYDSIDIPVASLGKDAPDRIVSYLRSHPDVNYVALSVSNALGAGLPAAFRAAGLSDRVKVVGQSADTQTMQDLQAGNIKAIVPFDYYVVDYLMLDSLARHFAGVEIPDINPPLWVVTPETIPDGATESHFPVVENYREEFKKAWGKL